MRSRKPQPDPTTGPFASRASGNCATSRMAPRAA
jgi:hypothetical protein